MSKDQPNNLWFGAAVALLSAWVVGVNVWAELKAAGWFQ